MRLLFKILGGITAFYVLFWAALAVYFSFAERQKGLLEANLSALFDRQVTIQEVHTAWRNFSPVVQINGFRVEGDTVSVPALAFSSMSAEIDPLSLLVFWPKLTKLAVQNPLLEVVTLPGKRLQIAGIPIGKDRPQAINPRRLIAWLINHESASWLNGEIVWRRANGEKRYRDVSFVYEREEENRKLSAATVTSEGAIAFRAESNGNMLEETDWDASLEILGDGGQRLIAPDDLSLVVENGKGRLQLRSVTIARIRDFLLLTGLAEVSGWLMETEMNGILENVRLDFSGSFLQFDDWSLNASAKQVTFLPTAVAPGLSNLRGTVSANPAGGTFSFATNGTSLEWPTLFDTNFDINHAAGHFIWGFAQDGKFELRLEGGEFADNNLTITDINARCELAEDSRSVNSIADLFTVDSVSDLAYEQGRVVQRKVSGQPWRQLFLDASAKFSVSDLSATEHYFPNDRRIEKLKLWWGNAFEAGSATNGLLRYSGSVSPTALKTGDAQLSGRADFADVQLDYGYQRDWPKVKKASGAATLENGSLTFLPTEAWIEEDRLGTARVSIDSLYELSRELNITGTMETELATVVDFLFDGPLIVKNSRLDETPKNANGNSKRSQNSAKIDDVDFPISADAGVVAASITIKVPLADVRQTTVTGSGTVRDGRLLLPQGVPIEDISTTIEFTERSASAKLINGRFLDGDITARLVTTEAAQPPKLSVRATGNGDITKLEPWIGEHILSWMDGRTDWEGEVIIDGPKVAIVASSQLEGITVNAPPPVEKSSTTPQALNFAMRVGGPSVAKELVLDYADSLRVHMAGDLNKSNSLFDRGLIAIADDVRSRTVITPPGVNFLLEKSELDIDAWLEAVIDLATLKTKPIAKGQQADTSFLDAMRSVVIKSDNPTLLGRKFGDIGISAYSTDGHSWIGTAIGDNINGVIRAAPRDEAPYYTLNLSLLNLVEAPKDTSPPDPIDPTLQPSAYPRVELNANTFILANKKLGRLRVSGASEGNRWQLNDLRLDNTGISTTGSGEWVNNDQDGSISRFQIRTEIDEAGGVLDEMQFNDLVRKGEGSLEANLSWIGAPHEFDFGKLNGDFDLQINNGELVQVESGAGRLIGLLNFNSILRRITLDFRDVFASGLSFDRMQYTGVLADGKAILREAFMFSPAVFVQMEGNIDLDKEYIDMEIHASPELGGNLALLSALANPAAGAVVYLTQRIFKDQMRANSFTSYRALGSWDEFELAEIKNGKPVSDSSRN